MCVQDVYSPLLVESVGGASRGSWDASNQKCAHPVWWILCFANALVIVIIMLRCQD